MKCNLKLWVGCLVLSMMACTQQETLIDKDPNLDTDTDIKTETVAQKGAYYTGNRDISAKHAGTTFTNATFADGATIFNTHNVRFVNCTFQNPRGHGVRFRKINDNDDSRDIEFVNCRFLNSRYDNVNISRDDEVGDRVLHKNVRFEGCYFEGWANNGSTQANIENRRFYHAIYAKCPNVTINNCRFLGTIYRAGHAVSIRSSARVTNNVFQHKTKSHNAISYSPKNLPGTPDKGWDSIIMFNNLIYTKDQYTRNGMMHIETQLNEKINPNNIINSMTIAFNTVVLLPGGHSERTYISALRVNDVVQKAYIAVYGNLFVDGRNQPNASAIVMKTSNIDYYSNNLLSTNINALFRDWRNRDYRLKPGSPAIGFANNEQRYIFPKDRLGNPRSRGHAHAGCYMQ